MTDIVERLRTGDVSIRFPDGSIKYVSHVAADEIERLREALKQAGLYAWQGDTFKIMDIVRAALGEKE